MNFLNILNVASALVGLFCTGCGKPPAPTAHATPAPPVHSIVAIGDSETYGRSLERYQAYPAQLQTTLGGDWQVFNQGISGQTTREMLDRFQTDVIDLHPGYVIIMGGENDVYYGYDASTNDASYHNDSPTGPKANILSMVVRAQTAGIIPLVGIMLPHGTIETVPARETAMYDLIDWERSYFPTQGVKVIDFYNAIVDPTHPEYPVPAYTVDLLHASAAGCTVMATLAATYFQ